MVRLPSRVNPAACCCHCLIAGDVKKLVLDALILLDSRQKNLNFSEMEQEYGEHEGDKNEIAPTIHPLKDEVYGLFSYHP